MPLNKETKPIFRYEAGFIEGRELGRFSFILS